MFLHFDIHQISFGYSWCINDRSTLSLGTKAVEVVLFTSGLLLLAQCYIVKLELFASRLISSTEQHFLQRWFLNRVFRFFSRACWRKLCEIGAPVGSKRRSSNSSSRFLFSATGFRFTLLIWPKSRAIPCVLKGLGIRSIVYSDRTTGQT